jgi:hypothetical protein
MTGHRFYSLSLGSSSFAFPDGEAPLFSEGRSGSAARRRSGFGLIQIRVDVLVNRSSADFRSDNRPSTSTVGRFRPLHPWTQGGEQDRALGDAFDLSKD